MRREAADSAAKSVSVKPKPSEDLRKRKMPLARSVSAPRKKTRGTVEALSSGEEKNQKEADAAARKR